ncbi:MAG: hypothetical protein L6R48_23550 [Planctomycetes bacterium]|nr:hypothetical protein [Planctomycetota bacterium]
MSKPAPAVRSFGHFSPDGREFVITDPLAPPRAQINFLWNDTLISGLNQFGSGDGVFNNQTLMYNHEQGRVRLIRDGRRYCYVRDCASGELWNAGLFPINTPGRSSPPGSAWATRCSPSSTPGSRSRAGSCSRPTSRSRSGSTAW